MVFTLTHRDTLFYLVNPDFTRSLSYAIDSCLRRNDERVKSISLTIRFKLLVKEIITRLPAFEILAKTFKFGLCGVAQACLSETRCGELSLQAQNNSNVEILKNFRSLEFFFANFLLFQDKRKWNLKQDLNQSLVLTHGSTGPPSSQNEIPNQVGNDGVILNLFLNF